MGSGFRSEVISLFVDPPPLLSGPPPFCSGVNDECFRCVRAMGPSRHVPDCIFGLAVTRHRSRLKGDLGVDERVGVGIQ